MAPPSKVTFSVTVDLRALPDRATAEWEAMGRAVRDALPRGKRHPHWEWEVQRSRTRSWIGRKLLDFWASVDGIALLGDAVEIATALRATWPDASVRLLLEQADLSVEIDPDRVLGVAFNRPGGQT